MGYKVKATKKGYYGNAKKNVDD
ncbi:hypothetical protein MNBD_NITROSPINAE02-1350, partial [hydrothermal vent metagenome]